MTSAGTRLNKLIAENRIRVRQGGRMLRWYAGYAAELLSRAPTPMRPPPWPAPALAAPPLGCTAKLALPRPTLYGEVVPPNYHQLPPTMPVYRPTVTLASDVLLFDRHVFTTRHGELLPQSLETEQPKWSRQGWNTRPPRRSDWRREVEEVFVVDSGWHHYGHVLLEAVPQLLLLDQAPADIGIATSIPAWPWFSALVEGLGIDRARLRQIGGVLPARRAYLPRPPIDLRASCHPLALEGFQRLRAVGRRSEITAPERLFVSRSGSAPQRRLINQAEIEALFESRGFTVFYPELHPIEVQIAMMSGAKLIAGLGGSAMHNTVFADPQARILFVSSSAWFVFADALLNQGIRDIGYVFGTPSRDQTTGMGAPWRVGPAAVAAAIRGHFGL